METNCVPVLAFLFLCCSVSRGQNDEASGDGSDDPDFSTPLIAVVALIGVFFVIIVVLSIAVVVMCRKKPKGRVDFKRKVNTYRGFSQERTQSPPESNAVHPPLPRQLSTKSACSHSHSHPPTSPSSLHPSTTGPTPQPHQPEKHTYHHLRQQDGMQLLPSDYPDNEYSHLGPRSETPPLRPPKPPHLINSKRPHSNSTTPPQISATAPPWNSDELPVENDRNHNGDSNTEEVKFPMAPGGEMSAMVPRTSIYDTMEDSARTKVVAKQPLAPDGSGQPQKPKRPDGYDNLARKSSSRKSEKATVRIFDDPNYSPVGALRSDTVRTTDPRYAGNYERHPDYVAPQIDIPKQQLDEKYLGDYERDPAYFSKLPDRSFSVSTSTSTTAPKPPERRQSLNQDPRLAKYQGEYEWSEDYVPPPLQNRNQTERTQDLEPSLNYTGDYERHPEYVPPLIRRPSRTKEETVRESMEYTYPFVPPDRPAHIPHEYTALADMLKDPPQEYTSLKPDSTLNSIPLPKDTAV